MGVERSIAKRDQIHCLLHGGAKEVNTEYKDGLSGAHQIQEGKGPLRTEVCGRYRSQGRRVRTTLDLEFSAST